MNKKLAVSMRKMRNKDKGDYLVLMRKGLSWKYYQQFAVIEKKGI